MSVDLILWGVLAAPALMVLVLTLFNEFFWPRGRVASTDEKISILVPCRNEESSIERVIRAAMQNAADFDELVVYDDGSTDATPEILGRLQAEYPKLRVEKGIGLPEGWVGKPHACHQLARHAAPESDILFFLDADVELEPGGVSRVMSLFRDMDAELVTGVPRQVMLTFFERLVLPVLHLTYTAWLPLPLIWKSHDPRFLAANGQLLAVTRETYDAVGGFESVRNEVVDDMAFCRKVKHARRRVVFADGHLIARCRMYEDTRGVWEGFSKNLYEGIGGTVFALFVVLALYLVTFVLPYVALVLAAIYPMLWAPALAGVAANVLTRVVLVVRHEQPLEGILVHPLGILAFCAIAVNSFAWNLAGAIEWSGRVYAARSKRQ